MLPAGEVSEKGGTFQKRLRLASIILLLIFLYLSYPLLYSPSIYFLFVCLFYFFIRGGGRGVRACTGNLDGTVPDIT